MQWYQQLSKMYLLSLNCHKFQHYHRIKKRAWRPPGPCCVHVPVTGYLTPKVPSMTIYYCSASRLSHHCLSLSLSLSSVSPSPSNPSCTSASELLMLGLKIPAPWQWSVTCLSASYLIHLSILLWLIFTSPISFSLSYVILIWLCQKLIWPMFPYSKSPCGHRGLLSIMFMNCTI